MEGLECVLRSLEPSRKQWKVSKWRLTWPDLDTPQEGSVEAGLKVRWTGSLPLPSSERPNDSGQLGPSSG